MSEGTSPITRKNPEQCYILDKELKALVKQASQAKRVNSTTKGKKDNNIKSKSNESVEKADHAIQLNVKNMVSGKLVNKQSVLCLIDSGASVSVVSQGLINKSQYLSSIQPTECPPIVL